MKINFSAASFFPLHGELRYDFSCFSLRIRIYATLGIDTFSPVSKKDSLRIIKALVGHFDLKLHQMDVKTAFFNGDLHEEVYMDQSFGFKIQ